MDENTMVIAIPPSMSTEGRVALRQAIAAIITAFSQTAIPEEIGIGTNEHKTGDCVVGDTGLEPVTL